MDIVFVTLGTHELRREIANTQANTSRDFAGNQTKCHLFVFLRESLPHFTSNSLHLSHNNHVFILSARLTLALTNYCNAY